MENTGLDFEMVCKFVGQLFLESRAQVEQLSRQLETTRQERDQALTLLRNMGSPHATATAGIANSPNMLGDNSVPNQ